MRNPAFVLSLAALAVAGAGAYAADRYAADRDAKHEREEAQRQLEQSVKLAAKHPRAFGAQSVLLTTDSALKSIAQEFATNRGVTLGYLSESERETEKGRRERQVILRLVNAGHPNLVLFLQDLESRGGGARVKEIHIRPSREIPDAYEEAEIVLSKFSSLSEAKKP